MKGFSEELIAPCGMNCRICVSFFGYTMNGKKRKIKCIGCKPRDRSCAFIKKICKQLTKKEIDYCYECKDFPCKSLKNLDNAYRERYNMSMINNLEYMKENGIKKFLQEHKVTGLVSTQPVAYYIHFERVLAEYEDIGHEILRTTARV